MLNELLYFAIVIIPFFLMYMIRQRIVHGVPNANDFLCQQGFHKLEKQTFEGNDYIDRKFCSRCGYIPPNQ